MISDKSKKNATALAIALTLTAGAEGVRQTAYWDPYGKVATACFGETKNIQLGDKFTMAQCQSMLAGRLKEFGDGVDRCTTVYLPPARKAAMADFAYNEGVERYCRGVAPLLNLGRTQDACDKLMQYTKAGGITLPGLVKRRQNERALCVHGLA